MTKLLLDYDEWSTILDCLKDELEQQSRTTSQPYRDFLAGLILKIDAALTPAEGEPT